MDVDRETLTLATLEILVALGAAGVFHVFARAWTDPRDPVGITLAMICVGLPLVSAAIRLLHGAQPGAGRALRR